MADSEKKLIKISASKLDKLDSCSWLFWVRYNLKLPDEVNSGALRGWIVHLIIEVLSNKRHLKYYYEALSKNSILKIKPLKRLVEKHAKRLKINNATDVGIIDDMTMTALGYDFLCADSEGFKSEHEFKVTIDDKYVINGFIDRIIYYKDKILVRDFKTSKSKFSGDKIDQNYQALMYALACYIETGKIPEVEFVFLKFKNKLSQKAPKITKATLEGFKYYLEQVAKQLENFDINKAQSSMAVDSKKTRWLCGKKRGDFNASGNPAFICPFKYPFDYYEIKDEKDKVVECVKNITDIKNINPKHRIYKKHYSGCPAW